MFFFLKTVIKSCYHRLLSECFIHDCFYNMLLKAVQEKTAQLSDTCYFATFKCYPLKQTNFKSNKTEANYFPGLIAIKI